MIGLLILTLETLSHGIMKAMDKEESSFVTTLRHEQPAPQRTGGHFSLVCAGDTWMLRYITVKANSRTLVNTLVT